MTVHAFKLSALFALLAVATSAACSKDDESNLAKLAEEQDDDKPEVEPADPPAEGGADSSAEPQVPDGPKTPAIGDRDPSAVPVPPTQGVAKLLTPGADEDRVQLRLGLEEGVRYRVTTIGMLKLPLVQKPTGFAREEELELGECEGEGAGRSCTLTHRYLNYEAEPPAGSGLEADEKQVAELVTSHRLDASGLRSSGTKVEGEATPGIGKQLAEVHRMFCVRFPAEAVGVGATWRDVCRMRQGGSLVTRELTWRLAKVDAGEEGTRAELEYAGKLWRQNHKGEVTPGEIQGVMYFWVDAGAPHLLRERAGFVLNPSNGLGSSTDFRYQFAKLGEDGETLLRTDGKPFEQSPQALNDPRRVPGGTTRDGELPADAASK